MEDQTEPVPFKMLHADLLALRDKMLDAENYAYFGICCSLSEKLQDNREVHVWLQEAFREWPEWSGCPHYPVPHPFFTEGGERTAAEYASAAYGGANKHAMWSPDHPYGAARRRLLDFLIARAGAEIA